MTNKVYNKQKLKAKLESYVSHAKIEYKLYKEENDTTKLAEAGEKLWGAFNYLMELKQNKSLKNLSEVRKAVYDSQDTTLIGIYDKAFSLHQFFYGWTDRIEDIEERFKTTFNGIDVYSKRLNENFLTVSRRKKSSVS